MKRNALIILLVGIFSCISARSAYSWILVDNTLAPMIPIQGMASTIVELDNTIYKNFRNYPSAFSLANVGGYPIGDACIGDFPHMYFGVSFAVGCANMKHYDKDIAREKNIYPAYAPNPVLNFGFGLKSGFDLLIKLMIFTDAIYRIPLNQKSAKLGKSNYYSGGARLRKNLIKKKEILPHLLSFGGLTIAVGADYMEGIMGISGNYEYKLSNISVSGGLYDLTFNAYYNFNLKWWMMGVNGQAVVYMSFLWIFDIYAGVGAALTYGKINLDGSGVGTLYNSLLGYIGILNARAEYHRRPEPFMGLFVAGLEINLWILKLNFETNVNITNGRDINLQLGTRFQF